MPDTSSPIRPPSADNKDELAAKREDARTAMEGPERTAKRERDEHQKQTQEAREQLESRLNAVRQEKEKLEVGWVELDNKRKTVRTTLNPLLDEEKKAEAEEIDVEAEEARIGLPEDKKVTEEKRWKIQNRRHELEEKKWDEEGKITGIEKIITENTGRYRQLLDEEDKLQSQLDALNNEEPAS